MSLGKYTKCDLDANTAKLDLTILIKQVEIHYYSLLEKMENKVSEVRNDSISFTNRKEALLKMASTGSDKVSRLAEQIAETTELLYTLYNTAGRKIEIVNIPVN